MHVSACVCACLRVCVQVCSCLTYLVVCRLFDSACAGSYLGYAVFPLHTLSTYHILGDPAFVDVGAVTGLAVHQLYSSLHQAQSV
jgi:hypothetical protein